MHCSAGSCYILEICASMHPEALYFIYRKLSRYMSWYQRCSPAYVEVTEYRIKHTETRATAN